MANDIISAIDSDWQATLSKDDLTEWMLTALVPMMGYDYTRIDFDLLGWSIALWDDNLKYG